MRPVRFRDRRVRLSRQSIPLTRRLYFFADYVDGRIFGLKYEGGKINNVGVVFTPPTVAPPKGLIRPKNLQPSSFGEDADGELYVCDVTNGRVFKMEQDTGGGK